MRSTIIFPAWPSPNRSITCSPASASFLPYPVMLPARRPARVLDPTATVSGLYVFFRSVTHGTPGMHVSSRPLRPGPLAPAPGLQLQKLQEPQRLNVPGSVKLKPKILEPSSSYVDARGCTKGKEIRYHPVELLGHAAIAY